MKKSAIRIPLGLPLPTGAIVRYATMVRIVFSELKKSRIARLGALAFSVLVSIAVFADVLAADLPIVCRVEGTVYVCPSITRPHALVDYDNAKVARATQHEGWAFYPLVRFGPHSSSTAEPTEPLAGPGHRAASGLLHPLGTDAYGRDVFARLVHGTRTALFVGLVAAIGFFGIGMTLGALSGFLGGWTDIVVARLVETLTSFPSIVLVLVIQALVREPSMQTLLIAIGLTRWTEVARLVRAEVLLVSAQDYVTAARALGVRPWRILWRHVLPNAVAPALVSATFGVATVVLIEAALTFLGVGLPPGIPSWGEMMSEARTYPGAAWLLVAPTTMLFVTVASLNLVGDALRDALDPRLRDAVTHAKPVEPSVPSQSRLPPPTSRAFDDSARA